MVIKVKRYNRLQSPTILPTEAPPDIGGAFHEVGEAVGNAMRAVKRQELIKAGKQASDIEVQALEHLQAAMDAGNENITGSLDSFLKESLEAASTEDGFYNDALRERVQQFKPRLMRRAMEVDSRNRALAVSSALQGVIDNKASSAAKDPGDYEQYLNEALSEIDMAEIRPQDRFRMKAAARDMIAGAAVGTRIRENPFETAAELREGRYNGYFDTKTLKTLERQADDEAFYRQLRADPESLSGQMDMFESYDEKTKFERERQVKSVLKSSKEKQSEGVSKAEADSQSALQSIRAQFLKDTYTEMKAKKKDRDLFSLLTYREVVGQAYKKNELTDKQFSGLMKETVSPLLEAAQKEAFKKPLFYQTAFEYSVRKLNSALGERMNNPTLKAAVLDNLYGRMREAGIDPGSPRSENKEAVHSVLSGIYHDFSDQESPYPIPENVEAMVLGGRYFPLSVKERKSAPEASVPVRDGGLFQDVRGNLYRRSNGVLRLVSQAAPEPAPKPRTIEDVIEESRPREDDREYLEMMDFIADAVEGKNGK